MFETHKIKDSRRGEGKRNPPTVEEIHNERPDERSLPYFSVVPEQFEDNPGYLRLDLNHKGMFLIFTLHVLWRGFGRCIRHPGAIAKRMGIDEVQWLDLEEILLACGLIEVSPNGIYLVQMELRTQYLMTLETNNNKRRK